MSNQTIKIGKPFIREVNNRAELVSKIYEADKVKELYFSVDLKYKEYLVTEKSDAFLLAVMYYAMVKGYDITWEQPCNNRLVYQLRNYYIPVLAKECEYNKSIKLDGPITHKIIDSKGAVATGLSNGVDSIYTIKKHIDIDDEMYRLTHVLFTDWFNSDFSEAYKKDYLDNYLSRLPMNAKELGLEFIYVHFNVDELFSVGHIKMPYGIIQDQGLSAFKYCAMAFALEKLIGVYYFSNGFPLSDFTFKIYDCAYFDLFTLPLIETQQMLFYSTGMEVSRLEKVKEIVDWEYTKNNLQVCAMDNNTNCGRCGKCIRTMSELYAIGKLDEYKKVFPVEDFYKNFNKRFGHVLYEVRNKHCFEVDTLAEMKKNGKKIPLMAYVWEPILRMKEFLRKKFRTVRWARKIYRKYHLDKLLYGRSTEIYTQSVDEEVLNKNA